jgi:hypothetical protein
MFQHTTSCKIIYDTAEYGSALDDAKADAEEILSASLSHALGNGALSGGLNNDAIEVDDYEFAVSTVTDQESGNVHATVTLTVTVDGPHTPINSECVDHAVRAMYDHIAGEGGLSGNTDLTVDRWGITGTAVMGGSHLQTAQPAPASGASRPHAVEANSASTDALTLLSTTQALGMVVDLESSTPSMGIEEKHQLYTRLMAHIDNGVDGFEKEGLHVFHEHTENGSYTPADVVAVIDDYSVAIRQSMKHALEYAHAGLIDAAIEGSLDSDAGAWHMESMVDRGFAQERGADADPLAVAGASAPQAGPSAGA